MTCCGVILRWFRAAFGMFLLLVTIFLGFLFAFTMKIMITPESMSAEDSAEYDQFTLSDILNDMLQIVIIGIVCGLGGCICVGWSWSRSWRVVSGIFLFGFLLVFCENILSEHIFSHNDDDNASSPVTDGGVDEGVSDTTAVEL